MKKTIYLVLALLMTSMVSVNAQVTIGSDKEPHSAAVLDLQSTSKGLKLPSIALDDDKTVFVLNPDKDKASAPGMMVFNTVDSNVYVWDGTSWKMVSDSGNTGIGTGNISTSGDIPLVEATGGSTGLVMLSTDCNGSGIWTIMLRSGEGAALTNVNSSWGTFEIEFEENTSTSARTAIVAVKDPCGYAKDILFSQKGTLNPGDYSPTPPAGVTLAMNGISCFDVRTSLVSSSTYTVSAAGAKSIDNVSWYVEDKRDVLTNYSTPGYTNTLSFKSQSEVLGLAQIYGDVVSVKLIAYMDITLSDNSTSLVSVEKNVTFRNGMCCEGFLLKSGAENGSDLCFYKSDSANGVSRSTAISTCTGKLGSPWRLPTCAEMNQISGTYTTLSNQPDAIQEYVDMTESVEATKYNAFYVVKNGYLWRPGKCDLWNNTPTGNFGKVRCVREMN